jgi:NADPH-ferrihemoprotein reductase
MDSNRRRLAVAVAAAVAASAAFVLWRTRRMPATASSRVPTPPPPPPLVKPPSQTTLAALTSGGDPRKIAVVFATSSGTAELFAKCFVAEARAKGLEATLFDAYTLNATLVEALANAQSLDEAQAALSALLGGAGTIVMIVATHGDGDPPESAVSILKALEDVTRRVGLSGQQRRTAAAAGAAAPTVTPYPLHHAVFGLGDRSYKFYCRAGKRFNACLEALGSKAVIEMGDGDARQDTEGAFDNWQERLWEPLAAACGVALSSADSSVAPPAPELTFAFRDDVEPASSPFPPKASALEPSQHTPFGATILAIHQLVASPLGRPTVEVMLDVTGASIAYQAGDHCGVMPRNTPAAVERCLYLLGVREADRARVVELTTPLRLAKRASPANALPNRVSLRDAFAWYVDLHGAPRRSTVRLLARYATNGTERQTLAAACADTAAFAAFIKTHRTIVDVLDEFESTRCTPVGHLLEALPKIPPRYYSIGSDSLAHPTTLRLCVVHSEGGLVSSWLAHDAKPGDKMFLFVRHSNFNLPLTKKAAPVVMIGAGTGIAPYIGFLERREHWKVKKNVELGPAMLYFGCRGATVDHLFSESLKRFQDVGALTQSRIAFSRDGPAKVYVQHLVAEDADRLWELLGNQQAYVYLCGDAAGMAKAVEETIRQAVLMQAGGMSEAAAKAFIANMEKSQRLLKDVWTS